MTLAKTQIKEIAIRIATDELVQSNGVPGTEKPKISSFLPSVDWGV